jgi:hypothetical protein
MKRNKIVAFDTRKTAPIALYSVIENHRHAELQLIRVSV